VSGAVSLRAESGDNFGQIVPHISLRARAFGGQYVEPAQRVSGRHVRRVPPPLTF
jgi:hypothetical protein